MNKETLKTILKPVLKECIEEILAEQGLLKVLAEAQNVDVVKEEVKKDIKKEELKSNIKKMIDATPQVVKQAVNETQQRMQQELKQAGLLTKNFDPFANTKALTEAQATDGAAARGPLAGIDPQDKGVDISGIMNMAAGKWKAHMGGKSK